MALQIEAQFLDKASPNIQKLDRNLSKLDKAFKDNSISVAKLTAGITAVYGVYKTFDTIINSVVKSGFEYNRELEQQRESIKTLIVATSQNKDSLGNLLTVQEKYNLASKESTDILKELEKINANTPNTLGETAQIYKAMLPSMRGYGATQSELIQLTEKLSIASSSAGIQFQSLLAGVDGLASGTVVAGSDLGRFLNSIGLSNEELKKSSDVVDTLLNKLSGFKALDTYGVAVSNLTVEWQKLTGELTKDIFITQKEGVKELTKLVKQFTDNKENIKAIQNVLVGLTSSAITTASAFIRFGNGATILFSDIEGGISNAVDFTRLSLLTLEKKFLEFSRKIRETVVSTIGFENAKALGIDINFNEMTKQIARVEGSIQRTKNSINATFLEMKNTRDEGFAFNQVIIDAENNLKGLLKTQKEVTTEVEKSAGTKGKPSTVANKIVSPVDTKELDRIKQLREKYETDYYNLSAELQKQRYIEQFNQDIKYLTNKEHAFKVYNQKIAEFDKQIQEDKLKTSQNVNDGIIAGVKELKDAQLSTAEVSKKAFTDFATGSANELAKFVTTGKADFGNLAQSIIQDLIKIQIQKQITGLFGGLDLTGLFANGGAFNGGVQMFAKGGTFTNQVVDKPTMFAYGGSFGGSLGVMGEAGAEAVMPLQRDSSGKLGVTSKPSNVIVNITNNTGQDIASSNITESLRQNKDGETERVINIVLDGVNRNTNGLRDMLRNMR